jgi:hypothetical protein
MTHLRRFRTNKIYVLLEWIILTGYEYSINPCLLVFRFFNMGARLTRSDFQWVYSDEPHTTRRREMLRMLIYFFLNRTKYIFFFYFRKISSNKTTNGPWLAYRCSSYCHCINTTSNGHCSTRSSMEICLAFHLCYKWYSKSFSFNQFSRKYGTIII